MIAARQKPVETGSGDTIATLAPSSYKPIGNGGFQSTRDLIRFGRLSRLIGRNSRIRLGRF